MVQAFTRLAALVEGNTGGNFRLLEGNVHGVFADLVGAILIPISKCQENKA